MILIPFLLAQAAIAPPQVEPTTTEVPDQTITVTAPRLKATADALASCLARNCPPAEDIAAAIEHAENQFIAGEIKGARTTLLKARGRNKRHAATLPVPVSDLLYLDAQVASLLGLADYGRIATIDSVDALKAGLSTDDPRAMRQRLLVADVFLRQGRHIAAVDMYDKVARRAAELGRPDIQGEAMFRSLIFYATAASINPDFRYQAHRRYAALRATTHVSMRAVRDATVLLEARLALLERPSANIESVIKRLNGTRTTEPMLVTSPLVNLEPSSSGSGLVPRAPVRNQWVDFEYRITRDGNVADVTIANQAPQANGSWIRTVKNALAGRRYLPLDLPSGSAGSWRRERFMIVADLVPSVRSRIETLAGRPRLHSIDLTPPSVSPTG